MAVSGGVFLGKGGGNLPREICEKQELELFCKALSAPVRLEILSMLSEERMNLQEIAAALHMTAGGVTAHIRLLERAGLIEVESLAGVKGMQKLCSVPHKQFVLRLPENREESALRLDIPLGSYHDFAAKPTCGLATPSEVVGCFDQPAYFDDPLRSQAALLWTSGGYFEYRIPNYLQESQVLQEIVITQELCSEVPAPLSYDSFPSDIYFSINGVELGYWTAPKDYLHPHGLYTPSWWPDNYSQYGDLVRLSVSQKGCFLGNRRVSSKTLEDLELIPGKPFLYRISAPEKAENRGGLTLFGRGFGNYNQNISVKLRYRSSPQYLRDKAVGRE